MSTLELILRVVKALIEVAGFAYIGQGIVGLFSGARRDHNFFYSIFKVVTGPITRFVRMICPKFVIDNHIPLVAFGILFWVWVASLFALAYVRANGL